MQEKKIPGAGEGRGPSYERGKIARQKYWEKKVVLYQHLGKKTEQWGRRGKVTAREEKRGFLA